MTTIPTPSANAPDTDPAPGLTGTPRALYLAVLSEPGSSAPHLALLAGISRSTASKVLAAMENEHLVTREKGGRTNNRPLPDLWHPVTPAPTPSPAVSKRRDTAEITAPLAQEATPASPKAPEKANPRAESSPHLARTAPATPPEKTADPTPAALRTADGRSKRLGQGELRAAVIAHLRAHPGQEFSPTQLSRTLERSAGAIANACAKAESDGMIRLTCAKPRRYSVVPDAGKN